MGKKKRRVNKIFKILFIILVLVFILYIWFIVGKLYETVQPLVFSVKVFIAKFQLEVASESVVNNVTFSPDTLIT